MKLLAFIFSFSLLSLHGSAQETEPQDDTEAKKGVQERVVVTGSRLRRSEFHSISPLERPKTTVTDVRKALNDQDTRVYALDGSGDDYIEVTTEKDLALLSPDQLDTLRFISNPVARSKERTIGIVNADDILRQTPQKAADD